MNFDNISDSQGGPGRGTAAAPDSASGAGEQNSHAQDHGSWRQDIAQAYLCSVPMLQERQKKNGEGDKSLLKGTHAFIGAPAPSADTAS